MSRAWKAAISLSTNSKGHFEMQVSGRLGPESDVALSEVCFGLGLVHGGKQAPKVFERCFEAFAKKVQRRGYGKYAELRVGRRK